MSSNNITIKIGTVLSGSSIDLFQTLEGDTLNVIGPSYKGKAFVPQNITDIQSTTLLLPGEEDARAVPTYNTVENIIGEERKNRYRHLNDGYSYLSNNQSYDAIKTWLDGAASQSTFTRVLGIGSGVKDAEGKYIGSGFNAANKISKGSTDNLTKSANPQSKGGNINGNVSFIASNRKNHAGYNYIQDLGLLPDDNPYFFDRVIISPDGILSSLNIKVDPNDNTPSENSAAYNDQNKDFESGNSYAVELLGLDSEEDTGVTKFRNNIIFKSTAHNNEKITTYMPSGVITSEVNFWPERFLSRGHFTYASFPSSSQFADYDKIKLITTRDYSSLDDNTIPDFNSFQTCYQTAKTPWVTSQPTNRSEIESNRENIQDTIVDLFRFYSLDDGEVGNRFRIKINITKRGNHQKNVYSEFDIYLFEYEARNDTFELVDTILNINLNPNSKQYICRKFGDENTYYDIDIKKIVTKVKYPRNNKYLRVEVHPDVEDKVISSDLIPSGFRAYPHIRLNQDAFPDYDINNFYQMPLLYSTNYFQDEVVGGHSGIENNWGVVFLPTQFDSDTNKILPHHSRGTESNFISQHYFYTKYFLNGLNTESKNIWVEDDSYLNSFFHLEKIYYNPEILLNELDSTTDFYYSRKGNADGDSRAYINLDEDKWWDNNNEFKNVLENKLSFDFFTYGGFDGFDIRDSDKRFITNEGLVREVNGEDSSLSLNENPIFCAYNHAIDVAINDSLGNDILCTPGISNLQLAEKCINICEDKKNIVYISDINTFNSVIVDNYLKIKDDVANYILNKESDEKNTKLNSDGDSIEVLKDSVNNNFSKIINISDSLSSRFFIPVMGTLFGSKDDSVTKRIDPVLAVIQKASTVNPINISGEVFFRTNGYELSLLDTRLNALRQTWEIDNNDFIENTINVLYYPKDDKGLSIYSQNTTHEVSDSFFSTFRNIRTLNQIKKEIKFNLFTEYSISLKGPILFAQNSRLNSFSKILDLQLRNVLNNFKDRGLINDFYIILPDDEDERKILDLQNYIVRGTLILKFNNTSNNDIINLRIDDILSELSLVSEQSSIEIVQPTY
jgi:hypothetical protein